MRSLSQLDLDPALAHRRTASDYVVEALRRAIFDGQFADGEELNQVALASHFNVSRVPVREALRQLQAEGLVAAEPHRRAVVVGLTQERITEIFELRMLLESHVLAKAAPALDGEELTSLRALCEQMDGIADHRVWLEKNREFHRRLLEPARAPTTTTLVEQLTLQVERYVSRGGGLDRAQTAGREHRGILDALERGEVVEACRLLETHIAHTLGDLSGAD